MIPTRSTTKWTLHPGNPTKDVELYMNAPLILFELAGKFSTSYPSFTFQIY
jgi:hypothetical protein